MKNALKRLWDSWTAWIIFGVVFSNVVAQAMVIPSGSMKNTLTIGDMVIAKKFAYGIPLPRLPFVNTPMMPDVFGNGHLVEGDRPQREDVVIFLYPKNTNINYVKRCVATGGDEVIYTDGHLYLHPHEGEAYISSHFDGVARVTIGGKTWLEDPYRLMHPGVGYRQERSESIFADMVAYLQAGRELAMEPMYVTGLSDVAYRLRGNLVNAFYAKVPQDHFFMMGDNRENSSDSRFWGAVPYRLIVGTPWVVGASMEYRSYERMMHGDGGKANFDHADLSKVCTKVSLGSTACEQQWNHHRFGVRWDRVGKTVAAIEEQMKH